MNIVEKIVRFCVRALLRLITVAELVFEKTIALYRFLITPMLSFMYFDVMRSKRNTFRRIEYINEKFSKHPKATLYAFKRFLRKGYSLEVADTNWDTTEGMLYTLQVNILMEAKQYFNTMANLQHYFTIIDFENRLEEHIEKMLYEDFKIMLASGKSDLVFEYAGKYAAFAEKRWNIKTEHGHFELDSHIQSWLHMYNYTLFNIDGHSYAECLEEGRKYLRNLKKQLPVKHRKFF